MNTYRIEQRIESFSEIFEHDIFSINDYTFEHWDYRDFQPYSNSWLAYKTITASNMLEAMNMFRKGLIQILNRASFVSQCGMQYWVNSMFVLKTNSNPDNIFFMQSLHEFTEVPLSFQSEERDSLKILMEVDNEAVFYFLTESNLSMTNNARLVPLILALEALAGEKEITSTCNECGDKSRKYKSTNKEKIKEILGDKLFFAVYDYKTGLRNRLFHGKISDLSDGIDYAQEIYEKIILFFNKTYKTEISEDVIGAPRNGMGKYNMAKTWAKPKQNNTYFLGLRTLLPLFNEKKSNGFRRVDNSDFNQSFEYLYLVDNTFVNAY